jgi:hypothetical protein
MTPTGGVILPAAAGESGEERGRAAAGPGERQRAAQEAGARGLG